MGTAAPFLRHLPSIFTLNWAGDQPARGTGNGTLWSYDGAGNRTKHTKYANSAVQESIDYTYDLANRLWAKGTTNYGNSHLGERLTKTDGTVNWTYQYDGAARLVRTLNNGVIVNENVYDGSGMRVKRIEDGKTVYFVYNGNEPLLEYAAAEGKYTYYIYADEKAIAEESGGVVKYYHKDHLGSTRVVTDAAGTKIAEYTYEPFGKVIAGTDGKQQFTGKRQDGTGLYYFGVRFYDAEIGRFITADTYTYLPNDERILFGKQGINSILSTGFNDPQEYNRYAFCCNNPINKIDADGHNAVALSWSLGALEGIGIGISMVVGVGEVALGVGLVAVGTYMLADAISDSIMEAKGKKGNENMRDTGLRDLTDEEVAQRARDKSLPKQEQRRYQREEKARKERNRSKRTDNNKSSKDQSNNQSNGSNNNSGSK